jgi:hypothetical protein
MRDIRRPPKQPAQRANSKTPPLSRVLITGTEYKSDMEGISGATAASALLQWLSALADMARSCCQHCTAAASTSALLPHTHPKQGIGDGYLSVSRHC